MIYNFIFQNSICFMLVLLELTIVNCMLWSMFEEMLILLEVIFLIFIVLLFNDDSDICYPVSVWCNDFCLLVPSSIFFLDPFIRGFVCWFVMKLSCWNLSWSWDTVNCMCWVVNCNSDTSNYNPEISWSVSKDNWVYYVWIFDYNFFFW